MSTSAKMPKPSRAYFSSTAREVAVVAPPVAGEEPHRRAELVGSRQEIEGASPSPGDEGRPELAAVERADDDGRAVGADGVERLPHHGVRRERHAAQTPWPCLDGAFHEHLAHDADERQRLIDEVIAPPRPRTEAIHALVERPHVKRESPVGVMLVGEIGQRDLPGVRSLQAPVVRVEHLPDPLAVVHHDEPAARPQGLTLGRRTRLPVAHFLIGIYWLNVRPLVVGTHRTGTHERQGKAC